MGVWIEDNFHLPICKLSQNVRGVEWFRPKDRVSGRNANLGSDRERQQIMAGVSEPHAVQWTSELLATQYCSIAGEVHSNTAIPPIAAGEKRTGASIRLQSAIRPVSIAIAASMYNCTCVHCNCCRKCSIFNRYFKILPASLLNHHQSTSHHPVKPRVMTYNAKARL